MTDHEPRVCCEQTVANEPISPLEALRGSVLFYIDPFKPVGLEDWDALKERDGKQKGG